MKFDIIENSSSGSMENELAHYFKTCEYFEIAVAFISESALEKIHGFLNINSNKKSYGKLITGFYQCFNSKKVLTQLKNLENTSNRLFIKMSKNRKFHWKYYLFKTKGKFIFFVGSANFTQFGLSEPGELMIKIHLPSRNKTDIECIRRSFIKEWENSIEISRIPLEQYREFKQENGYSVLPANIKELLISTKFINKKKEVPNRLYVTLLTTDIKAKTRKIIEDLKPDWNDYLLCDSVSEFNQMQKNSICISNN
jgi:HKD family nuclease